MTSGTRSLRFEIFLISLAAIVLEISMTRIFSFKLYYYFTYLTLGVAMLGLGAGGVFVAISPWLRNRDPMRLVSACCLVAAISIPISYLVIALLQISVVDVLSNALELAKFTAVCTALFLPFLVVGVILAVAFSSWPEDMSRLYFADLVGAGLGCALSVPLFVWLSPPGAIAASGLLVAIAGMRCAAEGSRAIRFGNIGIAALLLASSSFPALIPGPVADPVKSMSPQRVGTQRQLFSAWSSVFRVDVLEPWQDAAMLTLHHDGNIGSALHRFDGDLRSVARFDREKRSKPFSVLPPNPRVLIVGAAGGQEVLASLYFGAREIVGIELNPVTISLLTDEFSEYTGHIAHDPRVTLINAEGRSFLERNDEKFDLIWIVAPDSYAAMNAASSGAFVLSESYLYTVEMIGAALEDLAEGGILCAQFGELHLNNRPNRTPRYVATAREAFRRLGIEDFDRHILVSAAPGLLPASTILLSREPFTTGQIEAYRRKVESLKKARMWHPTGPEDGFSNAVTEIIALPESDLRDFHASYFYSVTPITDDSPFFWHFTPFRRAIFGGIEKSRAAPDFEVATGERILVFLLVFAAAFAAVFILLPTLAIRDVWSQIPYKASAGVYFACLGLGFMFYEVSLIQKLSLFLGYPSYSLTVTLFSLLLSAGVGSLLSERYSARRNRAFGMLFGYLILITLALQFMFPLISEYFVTFGLAMRIVVSAVCLVPVGLGLGAFMPIGIATVSGLTPHTKQYVAWAWAVNGFFSVMASVLSTILSMAIGFSMVFLLSLMIYSIGMLVFSRIPQPVARQIGE